MHPLARSLSRVLATSRRDLLAATAALRGQAAPPFSVRDGSGWPAPREGGRVPWTPPEAAAMAPGRVVLRSPQGEHVLLVPPGLTILQAARREGLDLPSSCTVGGCGACRQRLVSGQVDLPARTCLTEGERAQGYVLLCVGRPRGEVVVELT